MLATGPRRGTDGRWTWGRVLREEATGQRGHRPWKQVVEESTAIQDEEQAEDLSHHEPETAMCSVEEASSTGKQ